MKPSALGVDDENLLREAINRHQPRLMLLVDEALAGRVLSIDEADVLRDVLGSELAVSGVDPEIGAINERGKQLDALIDRVATMSELHR
jgi:hypothetical protein